MKKNSSSRPWTPEDERQLRSLSTKSDVFEIAKILKRSEAAIRHRAQKLGLHIEDSSAPVTVPKLRLAEGRWSKTAKRTFKTFGWAIATVGLLASIAAFLPRVQIEFSETVQASSPFPYSVTLTNGLVPLANTSVSIRPCLIVSPDQRGKIIGSCKGTGGITMPGWQGHYLATDEKWTIPLGRNVPFRFDADEGDVIIVVTYWSSMLPRFLREIPARFVIHKQPDGTKVWIRRPVD